MELINVNELDLERIKTYAKELTKKYENIINSSLSSLNTVFYIFLYSSYSNPFLQFSLKYIKVNNFIFLSCLTPIKISYIKLKKMILVI